MPTRLTVLTAAVATLLALGGARSVVASSVSVVAPGRMDARTLPVVASGACWTGPLTFTPTQPFGNPPAYHKVTVAGGAGAFSTCVGQYADLSINRGGTQTASARSYLLGSGDTSGFTVLLTKGSLPVPVPAGTCFTLVIHP